MIEPRHLTSIQELCELHGETRVTCTSNKPRSDRRKPISSRNQFQEMPSQCDRVGASRALATRNRWGTACRALQDASNSNKTQQPLHASCGSARQCLEGLPLSPVLLEMVPFANLSKTSSRSDTSQGSSSLKSTLSMSVMVSHTVDETPLE